MLIGNFTKIKIHKNHFNHYKQFFSDVNIGDIIDVSVEMLHPKSTSLVECKCDICGNTKILEFRHYKKNIKKYDIYACSSKCSIIKREKTNLIKYGHLYHSMDKEKFNMMVKNTSQQKYGKDFYMQTEEFKERVIKTNLSKYGYKTPLQSENIKTKIKETNLLKYGFENPNQSEIIKNKTKKTNLLKYGYETASKSQLMKDKVKKTNLSKYGFEWPNQNQEIYHKIQKGRFKTKKYKNLFYKSTYELDFIKYCENKNITIENSPSIKYEIDNINRVYFPDFYLPQYNLIVEIKSIYTFNVEKELNLIKEKFCKKNNYRFIFIIDKQYENFELLINTNHFSS